MHEGGGHCLKYLKRGGKEESGNKNFKKRGASWFKKWVPENIGGLEPPYGPQPAVWESCFFLTFGLK